MHWVRLGRLTVILALLTGSLTACNYRDYFQKYSGTDYGSRPGAGQNADSDLMHTRTHGSAASDPMKHENKKLAYNGELSRQIASLPGVYSAFVFVTDRNAYVGIMTDWSATGTRARGGADEQNNTGTTEGVYNADNGSPQWDNRTIANLYNSYFTHKDVKDISSRLRHTIATQIHKADPKVKEVYISANREYVNQLAEYAKESWAGRPLTPLTADFNRLVQYIFAGGKEIPLPLYERRAGADNSPGGNGPEPKSGDK